MDIFVNPPASLSYKQKTLRCALGRCGVGVGKKERDGLTPVGRFPLRRVFYRPDRLERPLTTLPTQTLSPTDGWSDDAGDTAYNTLIKLPYSAGHERLWRHDGVYDVIIEVGYNDNPIVPGRGSAIFMHVAKPGYGPTEGCVALALNDLLQLLADCDGKDWLVINLLPE